MKSSINPIYQSRNFLENCNSDFLFGDENFQYIILDDFIEPSLYVRYRNIISQYKYIELATHKTLSQETHDIIFPSNSLSGLHDLFYTSQIDDYFSLLLSMRVRREFYITQSAVGEYFPGLTSGLVAQLYKQGDFYDWHIDGPLEDGSIGGFVYYLSLGQDEWQESDGGILEFGSGNPLAPYHKIIPKENRLIFLFASLTAFHRVTPITGNAERISIQSTLFRS